MSERKTLFVDVILPIPIRNEFTYRVPFEMNDDLFAGARVVVPFGRSKLITGIITKIHENVPKDYQVKYVEHILDDQPIITPNQYKFWNWISDYYMAPIGDVMNAALPSNFKLASETKIVMHPDFNFDPQFFKEREIEIIEALQIKETLDLKEISEIIGIKTIQPIVKSLIDKKAVLSLEELNDKFTPKTAVFIFFSPDYSNPEDIETYIQQLELRKGKEKQIAALLSVIHHGSTGNGEYEPVLRKTILEDDVSLSSLNTLEKKWCSSSRKNGNQSFKL